MRAWVQRCPHCDYCAPALSEQSGDLSLISTLAYQNVLNDERYPELARQFLAGALLIANTDPAAAAHARLHAAWVCDDQEQPASARECRNLAADCLSRLKPFEKNEQGIGRGIILVDILRRAGRFAEAAAECEELARRPRLKEILKQVLQFESRLIASQDCEAHLVSDATQ